MSKKKRAEIAPDTEYVKDILSLVTGQIDSFKESLGSEQLKVSKDDEFAVIGAKVDVSATIAKNILFFTREYMDITGIMDLYDSHTEKNKKEKIRGGTLPTGFESILGK